MTRIETFVAATFAFALTMLVISVDNMPTTFDEFMAAVKQIPAFAASSAIIIWIWHTHAIWSRRYGLEDATTIMLSGILIFLVLIYIYPLRLMMESLFHHISGGFFSSAMSFNAYWEIRFMFAFYGAGFLLLSGNFIALYLHAGRQPLALPLSEQERFDTQTEIFTWLATAAICALALLLALVLPLPWISFSGYSYFLLFPVLSLVNIVRGSHRAKRFAD